MKPCSRWPFPNAAAGSRSRFSRRPTSCSTKSGSETCSNSDVNGVQEPVCVTTSLGKADKNRTEPLSSPILLFTEIRFDDQPAPGILLGAAQVAGAFLLPQAQFAGPQPQHTPGKVYHEGEILAGDQWPRVPSGKATSDSAS